MIRQHRSGDFAPPVSRDDITGERIAGERSIRQLSCGCRVVNGSRKFAEITSRLHCYGRDCVNLRELPTPVIKLIEAEEPECSVSAVINLRNYERAADGPAPFVLFHR